MGTGRKRNLPQEMGHPRETNLQYHMTWDFQGRNWQGDGKRILPREVGHRGNWQVGRWEEEFSTGDGTSKVGTGRQGDRKRNLPQEMGHPREMNLPHDMGLPRPELAGRREEEFTAGGWASWELAGREMGRGI